MISVGSEVQVLPGPPSNVGFAEMRSAGGMERRAAMCGIAARYRVSDGLFVGAAELLAILSRGGVAQWESTCFASRGSSVRIRPSPFPVVAGAAKGDLPEARETACAALPRGSASRGRRPLPFGVLMVEARCAARWGGDTSKAVSFRMGGPRTSRGRRVACGAACSFTW